MSLSKENALAIKRRSYTLYSGPLDRGGIIQRVSDKIKGIILTDHFKCLAFDIS